MLLKHSRHLAERWKEKNATDRQGSILILTSIGLIALLAAAALSVDVGYIQVEKSKLQNACDAAALAASEEISQAVRKAPIYDSDPAAYAVRHAKDVACKVAALSGVYLDPDRDIEFGARVFNPSTQQWSIRWEGKINNIVKITARRDNSDKTKPDAKLKLIFGGVLGKPYSGITAQAVAFVNARDLVVVHDFSRSMNFDSHFPLNNETQSRLSTAQVITNMRMLWNDMNPPNMGQLKFELQYFTATDTKSGIEFKANFRGNRVQAEASQPLTYASITYATVNSRGSWSTTTTTQTYNGNQKVVDINIPSAGYIQDVTLRARATNGSVVNSSKLDRSYAQLQNFFKVGSFPYATSSYRTAAAGWDAYVLHCLRDEQIRERGFQDQYGGITFLNFIMRNHSSNSDTPAIATSRHYPFTSIKVGHALLCDYLADLKFDDRIGMVSYDTNHRVEDVQVASRGIPAVDIRREPITADYTAVKNLMMYKQANHYSAATNMGGGLKTGKQLLDSKRRTGSQGTILLMTDGQSNTIDPADSRNTALPSGWNWNKMFDYDGDGRADYSTSDSQKTYVLRQAYEAVRAGYVVNTMSVGADADTELLRAIAWLGQGVYFEVPGGTSTEEMEQQILLAFQKIASLVPEGKLMGGD